MIQDVTNTIFAVDENILKSSEKKEALPKELLCEIFLYLDKKNLQKLLVLSNPLRGRIQLAIEHNEIAGAKKFIRTLIDKLKSQKLDQQAEVLEKIVQNKTPENFTSLRSLKEYILQLQDLVISELKKIDLSAQENVENETECPYFMNDIFILTKFERRIENGVNAKSQISVKSAILSTISIELAKSGYVDRAILVGLSIPNEDKKWKALSDIAKISTQLQYHEKGLVIADLILDENIKEMAFSRIANVVRKAAYPDKELAIVKLDDR